MLSRALLLGTAASVLVWAGAAMAQTGSVTTGGSAAGGATVGGTAEVGTAGSAAGGAVVDGTGAGAMTQAAPTQLLPQGGVGTGDIQRSLSGLPQQGGTGSALETAGSAIADVGDDTGPVVATPTPMNAPSTLSGSSGTAVLTPTPLNAPGVGSSAVPPLTGTAVPALGVGTGSGVAPEEPGPANSIQRRLIREGFVRFDGQILSAREASRLQQQRLSQQQTQAAAGAQVIVLSGSVFQGTTDSPNVVVVPASRSASSQSRGLIAQNLGRGQPVLQGTVDAPRVIALAPAPGNVLVVQGSQIADAGAAGTGQIRAQIVELPAE
jgi:hypothetical protein